MSEKALQEVLAKHGAVVGSSVKPDDVAFSAKDIEAWDRSYKLRTIVNEWSTQQREDRAMRRRYANAVLCFLGGELVFIGTVFILIGQNVLEVSEWSAQTFVAGVFLQVITVATAVVKYLFPDNSARYMELLEKTKAGEV